MATFDVIMPKMGESITEATIVKWIKQKGDIVKEDDPIVEIATDKVDSEIPSPIEGVIAAVLFNEGDVVEVGKIIAVIATDGEDISLNTNTSEATLDTSIKLELPNNQLENKENKERTFYSPLVRKMAKEEQISPVELDKIQGSGLNGRITKNDVLQYLNSRKKDFVPEIKKEAAPIIKSTEKNEIVEMDRMRQLIAEHMLMSIKTSAHVTSFIEVDMSKVVAFRDNNKSHFLSNENEKLTFTHIILHVVAQTIKEFPYINASVDGKSILLKKDVNIGLATALQNGNLIVPVVKNADEKSLLGIVKNVNQLVQKARTNKLLPDDIQEGTFTITNLGSFNSLTGTPIINQPQVAILAVGAIKKRPVVIETKEGDYIGIKPMMYLSLTYDHRIVDGALGGMFLDKIRLNLENY